MKKLFTYWGSNNRLTSLLLVFLLLIPRINYGQEVLKSPVKNCGGQRVLGELCGTYTFKKAFPTSMFEDAYLQLWRTNPNTPQGQGDSLTISRLETHAAREICDGVEIPYKFLNHNRIVVKGLKIFYQKYKKNNTIGKEPSYYVLGTKERWHSNFEFNYIPGLDDYKERPNFDINKIGKRFRRNYKPCESYMEITKAMFDWLHKLSDDWKVIEEESQEVKDLDKKEDSDDDWLWLFGL